MKINKNSPIPIYHQLYEILKKKIKGGQFRSGEYLPSENKLAEVYGVSRLTVRQALSKLVEDGIVEKRRGKGTIALPPKNIENLTELRGFTDEARASGHSTRSVVLENKLTNVPMFARERLKLPTGSKVILLKRLRLLDDIPYAIEWAYINPSVDTRVLNILEMDMSTVSLYEFFRKTLGLRMQYADETLEVTKATPESAKLLMILVGECVVLRNRFTYVYDDKCLEYVQSLYRGDKYRFNIRLHARWNEK